MPCTAHKNRKKGDCKACGEYKLCPPPIHCKTPNNHLSFGVEMGNNSSSRLDEDHKKKKAKAYSQTKSNNPPLIDHRERKKNHPFVEYMEYVSSEDELEYKQPERKQDYAKNIETEQPGNNTNNTSKKLLQNTNASIMEAINNLISIATIKERISMIMQMIGIDNISDKVKYLPSNGYKSIHLINNSSREQKRMKVLQRIIIHGITKLLCSEDVDTGLECAKNQ